MTITTGRTHWRRTETARYQPRTNGRFTVNHNFDWDQVHADHAWWRQNADAQLQTLRERDPDAALLIRFKAFDTEKERCLAIEEALQLTSRKAAVKFHLEYAEQMLSPDQFAAFQAQLTPEMKPVEIARLLNSLIS